MEDKVYFNPGDMVSLEGMRSPIMKVSDVIKEGNQLIGIECFWFTTTYVVQRCVFNTKDLTMRCKATPND